MSKAQKKRLVELYGAEATDPVWLEGFADGQAERACSSPDMRRGHRYALGYITGRWQQPLTSMVNLYAH
jgi:hypothetical protein